MPRSAPSGPGPRRFPGGGASGVQAPAQTRQVTGKPQVRRQPASLRCSPLGTDPTDPRPPSLPGVLEGHRSAPPTAVVHPAGRRDQEALAHTQQPVQAVAGAADAHPGCLPALLRALHQAQRVQEAHGEQPWLGGQPGPGLGGAGGWWREGPGHGGQGGGWVTAHLLEVELEAQGGRGTRGCRARILMEPERALLPGLRGLLLTTRISQSQGVGPCPHSSPRGSVWEGRPRPGPGQGKCQRERKQVTEGSRPSACGPAPAWKHSPGWAGGRWSSVPGPQGPEVQRGLQQAPGLKQQVQADEARTLPV